jgi:hypothetical protein
VTCQLLIPKAWFLIGWLGALAIPVAGQLSTPSELNEVGRISRDGREVSYRIRHLPLNSFPDLPGPIVDELTARGCLIPQTYEAKRPENVVHASLEKPGSSDWALLCSARGEVSLLVFFASAPMTEPVVLAHARETERLQDHDVTGELGFNWGIDPASPKRVHEAQAGMAKRPPAPDHDSLADSTIDRKTIYHLYANGVWDKVEIE